MNRRGGKLSAREQARRRWQAAYARLAEQARLALTRGQRRWAHHVMLREAEAAREAGRKAAEALKSGETEPENHA